MDRLWGETHGGIMPGRDSAALTSGELLALRLLTQNCSSMEIARSFDMSEAAARGLVARVLKKLLSAERAEQASRLEAYYAPSKSSGYRH